MGVEGKKGVIASSTIRDLWMNYEPFEKCSESVSFKPSTRASGYTIINPTNLISLLRGCR